MRTRIPIAVVLGAFVALSCDQQPVGPEVSSAPELGVPLLSRVDHWATTWTDEFDEYIPCADEWAHFVINGKARFNEHEDANGGYHFVGVGNWHGTGIGENGSEWVAAGVWPTIWNFRPDAGETFHDHIADLWVGKGRAPSWNGFLSYQYTANGKGELVVEFLKLRVVCE